MSDDLTRIRGISPKLAARLNEAGITTFKQIADSSASVLVEKLGNASGISVETINKRNWIGQASELAAGIDTNIEPRSADLEARNYIIELFTDQNGEVRRTRIHHVEKDGEEMWDGWDAGRIIRFFEKRPELKLTRRTGEAEIPGTLLKPEPAVSAFRQIEVPLGKHSARPAKTSPSLTEAPLHL